MRRAVLLDVVRAVLLVLAVVNAVWVAVILRFLHPDWTETQLFLSGWLNVVAIVVCMAAWLWLDSVRRRP